VAIEISSKQIEPIRHTYDYVARRIGEGRPGSRYQEATFDIQPTANFQYPSSYAPKYALFDPARTAIVMEDWYAFLDPRQYYYSAYTVARAKQQEVVEKNFAFVESKNLLTNLPDDIKTVIRKVLIPLRHVEWAGNMNNCSITDVGYGTAITQATLFHAIDKLGIAQYLTRISLILEENEETGLDAAKQAWLEDEMWQPLRRAVEDMFVLDDWFELLVAQNVVLDGLLYPLVYGEIVDDLMVRGAMSLAMLTEFMREWQKEAERWTSAIVKAACLESKANAAQVSTWTRVWTDRLSDALEPIACAAFDPVPTQPAPATKRNLGRLFSKSEDQCTRSVDSLSVTAVSQVRVALLERLQKQGLKLAEVA